MSHLSMFLKMTLEKLAVLNPSFGVEVASIEDERFPDVLICVHGIRDNAAWCSEVAAGISKTTVPGLFIDKRIDIVCVTYRRLSSLAFIFGLRRRSIRNSVYEQIERIHEQYPNSEISIFAHSNGTKIIAELMPRFEFDVEWLFLGGSVCRLEDIQPLGKATRSPVNDAASRDWWPIIAETLRPSLFQATGVYGFHRFPVVERMFNYRHGGTTHRSHIERWVLPTILHGSIERTDVLRRKLQFHAPTYARRLALAAILVTLLFLLLR